MSPGVSIMQCQDVGIIPGGSLIQCHGVVSALDVRLILRQVVSLFR